jgi:hypothetical protein
MVLRLKMSRIAAALFAIAAGATACHRPPAASDGGLPGDGGLEVPVGTGDVATGDGALGDAALPLTLSARFANLDPDLGAFDVCMRTLTDTGVVVAPQPLLAGIAGLAGGVPTDRVSRRIPLPFAPRSSGRPSELFLVRPDTIDCRAPTGLVRSDRVFGVFATIDGERNTFVTSPLGFNTLVRERKTCPAATACVHFWNFTSGVNGTDLGPNLTFELVDGSNRTVVVRDLPGGEDGPAEPPFVFDINTGTTEIPWTSSTSALRLSVREATATAPLVDVQIPNAPGGLFTLWIVGKTGASGPAARRAVLCRDADPDDGTFSPCTTVVP